MHMANAIVKHRILILVLCILLLIPAAIGMQNTRINYDMLDYLPEDMDTVHACAEAIDTLIAKYIR